MVLCFPRWPAQGTEWPRVSTVSWANSGTTSCLTCPCWYWRTPFWRKYRSSLQKSNLVSCSLYFALCNDSFKLSSVCYISQIFVVILKPIESSGTGLTGYSLTVRLHFFECCLQVSIIKGKSTEDLRELIRLLSSSSSHSNITFLALVWLLGLGCHDWVQLEKVNDQLL